jgi:hypothetical protein
MANRKEKKRVSQAYNTIFVGDFSVIVFIVSLPVLLVITVFLKVYRHKRLADIVQDERLVQYSAGIAVLLLLATFVIFMVINNHR